MKSIKPLLTCCLWACLALYVVPSISAQAPGYDHWMVRYNRSSVEQAIDLAWESDGFNLKSKEEVDGNSYIYCHLRLDQPIKAISFNFRSAGKTELAPISLLDAAANVLWRSDVSTATSETVDLKNIKAHGQLIFKIGTQADQVLASNVEYAVSDIQYTYDDQKVVVDEQGFILINDLTTLQGYAFQDNVKVRLLPGYYQLDQAYCKQFIQFTGNNSVYDLTGAHIAVDTRLFTRTDLSPGINDGRMYCAIAIHGNKVQMEGPYVETYGDSPGIQSRNKIFNLTGRDVTLKNAEVRTSGSSPWGYGSFYGLGGGDVRKMNGIRIAWPGENIQLIGCKVHMRAMGHAIFVQGAKNTLIEDCHVDGLLRTTDDILAETSGYAFDKNFKAHKGGYIEGVIVAEDGTFLPGEMFSLSEDGIRIYPRAQRGADTATGATTIRNCTVTNMRRGICTGLNSAGDKVINCRVTNCYATGFNVGNLDTLINCSADAKYAEAVSVPYTKARNAYVDLEILDSRGGMKNKLLAKVNGTDHRVSIKTSNPEFIPADMVIKLSTSESYGGPWRGGIPNAVNISLKNETTAGVILLPGTEQPQIESSGKVFDPTISSPKKGTARLDMAAYLAAANPDELSPNQAQLEMLRAVMPEDPFQAAPPIGDRAYWDEIAQTDEGKNYLEEAISWIAIAPEVPITDSIYRVANLQGNRGIYKPRYYRTMTRLEHFILAECMENQGRFLPQIEVYINAIMDMKSWLHPNHDNKTNDVLEGRSMAIDLGSRRFGSDLALAEVLLEDRLSSEIRQAIKENLRRRIIDSYLQSTSGEVETHLNWYRGTSNWNSVCTSGSVFVTITTSLDPEERLAAVGTALNSMRNYLHGFGDDGYCSEGAGYWNYGFGHYLYLAQILYDYTDGAVDLFEYDHPEKLIKVANYPYNYQIAEGVCAPFSDGVSRVSDDGGFASKMVVRKFGATMPPYRKKGGGVDSYSAFFQLIEWRYMKEEKAEKSTNKPVEKLPSYTYFDEFGMVISRGKQETPLSIAIKAGHNSENHNHMDVGTYTVVLGKDIMTGDIGAPSYTAGAFDDDNPARSSWGHPVPRLDHTLQSKGRKYSGKIIATEFTDNLDRVVMDIKAAYEIPALNTLTRTMENDKSGLGAVSITDEFSASKPLDFGVAIMTLSEYEIINANTVMLKTEHQTLKAEVSSDAGALVIRDEPVPVEHLREGGPAYRIGVDFVSPIDKGSITVKYTPVF